MDKRTILFLFLLPIFVSCTQKKRDTNTEDLLFSEIDKKNLVDVYITDSEYIRMMKRRNNHFDYLNIITVLSEDAILYNSNEMAVGIIPEKTEIAVVASDAEHPYTYCLIKINNSNEVWTGWIRQDSLNQAAKYLLEHCYDTKNTLVTSLWRHDISPDNTMIAWWSNEDNANEICIFNNKGNILFNLKDEQIFLGRDPKNITGHSLGWSDDSKNAWFYVRAGFGQSYYVYVQAAQGTYEIFENPLRYHGDDIIDFNMGDYYYTDFEYFQSGKYQDETEYIEQFKEYLKQTFHIYKYNFFTKETVILESSYGFGFIIHKNNNKITYEKVQNSRPY